MSDLLSIGASGVRAYQTALTTVSENIANAGNTSYVRRTVGLDEIVAVGSAGANGMGVSLGGVSRTADIFKDAAVRSASANLARTETGSVWLGSVQSSLTGNDLSGRLGDFFNAAQALAADPTSSAARAVMLENATSVAAAFSSSGAALAQNASDLDGTAAQATNSLDSLGASLAKVNEAIGRAQPGSAAAAGLADQRDSILEQMSALADVDAQIDPAGRATVRLGGSSGPVFVTGGDSGTVGYTRNKDGAVGFTVSRAGNVATFTPSGGALAGIADGAQKIQDARNTLDSLATSFVAGVNKLQRQGEDANGDTGKPMFAVGSSPTDITVALSDPAGIAAAKPGEGVRGNGNLAALADLRKSAGFETRLTALVAGNAASIESRKTIATAQSSIRDGAMAARDSVSGVNLDNEAIDLMRFQQAYQASSRVIQVARETFQSIIGIN